MNERFTHIADAVSEALGHYLFTIVSLTALAAWTIYGIIVIGSQDSGWFTSQQWNFPLNTITTVGEWFIGALVAASANRVERRNKAINEQELELLEAIKEHTQASKKLHEATLELSAKIEREEKQELNILKDKGV